MNTARYQRVKEIYFAVCEQANGSAEQQSALLDALCDQHPDIRPDVRREVESLLQHTQRPVFDLDAAATTIPQMLADLARKRGAPAPSASDLAANPAGGASPDQPPAPSLPATIGDCRVLELLGEGGMGAVFLAEQAHPRRIVAVKVLHSGYISTNALRRFEQEAQLLARLQHPGIAQVFHAGAAAEPGGGPFIVMEHIDGVPLTTYADRHALSPYERLALMARVCDAVQHAHLRGVIHRDLKPANILVRDDGQPKVLDFGVARTLDADPAFPHAQTGPGQFIGTLSYMSPEQMDGSGADPDIRSDIYALGVLCYELLTGRLPVDLRGSTLTDAIRLICEPAARPRPDGQILRGDLGVIVERAMDPDRTRRYQSAEALASDIRRCIAGEPIEARRDSVLYVLRMQLRKYRYTVMAVCAGAALLTAAAIYASVQATRFAATAAREAELRVQTSEALDVAAAAKAHAAQQRDEAQAITGFLVGMLGMADPDITQTLSTSIRTLLDGASQQASSAFTDLPEAEATVRTHLGRIHTALGDPSSGYLHLRRAAFLRDRVLNSSDAARYEIAWPLMHAAHELHDVEAPRHQRDAEQLVRAILLDRAPEIRAWLGELHAVDPGAADRRAALLASLHLPDDLATLAADQLVMAAAVHADSLHAIDLYREALALYRDHLAETNTRIVRTLGMLIDALLESGLHQAAADQARDTTDLLQRLLPAEHWYMALQDARLGMALAGLGDLHAAENLLRMSHPRIVAASGTANPRATGVLSQLIRLLERRGRIDEAEHLRPLLIRDLVNTPTWPDDETVDVALGPHRRDLADALRHVRNILERVGPDIEEVFEHMAHLTEHHARNEPLINAYVADVLTRWLEQHIGRFRFTVAAEALLAHIVTLSQRSGYPSPRKAALVHYWSAALMERKGDFARGTNHARLGLAALERGAADDDFMVALLESVLGGCLIGEGRASEAAPYVLQPLQQLADRLQYSQEPVLSAFDRLLSFYCLSGEPSDFEAVALDALHNMAPQAVRPDEVGWSSNPLNAAGWRARGGHLGFIGGAAWEVIRRPGLPPALYAEVLPWTEYFVRSEPARTWNRMMYGACLYRLGRDQEAAEALTELVEKHPEPNVWAFLALVHARMGEVAAATDWAQSLLDHTLTSSTYVRNVRSRMLSEEALIAFHEAGGNAGKD